MAAVPKAARVRPGAIGGGAGAPGIPVRTLQWFRARYRDVADKLDGPALAALRKRFEGSILVAGDMSMAPTAQKRMERVRYLDNPPLDASRGCS